MTTVPLQYNTILCGLVHTSGNGFIKTLNKYLQVLTTIRIPLHDVPLDEGGGR